jgi:uncharacterized membrane protein
MTMKTIDTTLQKKESGRNRIVYAAILLFSLIWCASIFSVPFLADGNALSKKASGCVAFFFSPVCHQIPNRSFHLAGHPLAVCSRCTGIYLGFLFGVMLYPCFRNFKKSILPPRWILLVGILPIAVEVLFSLCRIIHPGNLCRCLTGFGAGNVTAFYVLPAAFDLANRQAEKHLKPPPRRIKHTFMKCKDTL